MDTQNTSVRPHAQARLTGKNHPPRSARANTHPGGGIVHDNSRHTTRFTVIGNHLAQHPELSGLAIGLGVHIQSLPTGARADIKTLAARFPEGPTRIAAALRELETHGHLHRTRERTESGRIVTRTVSCNQPDRHGAATDDAPNPSANTKGTRMVSSPHEAMHRIFQEHPDLFSRVSEVLGVDFGPPTSVTVLPTDLTEARPLERRVDTLLRLETEESYLLTKYRLQPILLVVCQDRATAEWAARPVHFGPRQWPLLTLRPLVAGPHNMPVITDPAEARKDLALATLSAITHGKGPDIGAILKAMTTALQDEPDAVKNPIIEFISQGLGKLPAAALWRKLVAVDLSFYKSPLFQEIRDEARDKGREEGREEGREAGRDEGQAQRAAEDVLAVLAERGIDVPEDARERINGCGDLEILRHWLRRAVTAPAAEDIFVVD
jgi:hypothetical protein